MSTTCKSPKRIMEVAYFIGALALAPYAHRFSPKKFTQPQLFACLVLKEFLQLDFRKLAALLRDAGELRAAIDLKKTPHFTTFQKASQRLLLTTPAQQLIHKTLRLAQVTGKPR